MGRTIPTCSAAFAAGLLTLLASPAAATVPDLLAYMQARAADGDGRVDYAATRYAAALTATPADADLATRTYREAIEAGDLALADRAVAALGPAAPADAALLALAKAIEAKDRTAADAAIARIGGGQLGVLAAPLRAWAAFDRGVDPLPALANPRVDPVSKRFAAETRAILLLARGRTADGMAALRAMLRNDQPSEDLRLAAARLLIGTGRRDAALMLLSGDAPAIVALRRAPVDSPVRVTPSLGFGASLLFTRVASDLSVGPVGAVSIVLAQAAVRADPSNDRARLLLANALAKSGAIDRALDMLASVPPTSIHAETAAAGRIGILTESGRIDDALALARTAAAPDDADTADIQRYADLLSRAKRPRDAAAAYKRLLDRAGDKADWSDWLQYGGALDEAGDWRRAEPALARAVTLAPNQPVALNYLGYARIAHGEDVAPARALLEQAVKLAPGDAAIADSLGWAYHLGGDSPRALPLIERAAAATPDNAEIGEHLGDIYWAIGRRYEARYAWRAAQVAADPKDATRLAARIANGLPRTQ